MGNIKRSVVLPEEMWKALDDIKKQTHKPVADMIREGVQMYLNSQGKAATADVGRGGYRGKKSVSKD